MPSSKPVSKASLDCTGGTVGKQPFLCRRFPTILWSYCTSANASSPQRRDHLVGRPHAYQQWQDVLDGHLVHVEFTSRAAVTHHDTLHIAIFGVPCCPFDAALGGNAAYQDGLR